MVIAIFFISHWFLAVFVQTFFLHRYGSHRMFRMSPSWERFFFLLTFIVLGSSYLQPRAYAIMHRLHHAHSDTDKDPHSPRAFRNVFQMMWSTFHFYRSLVTGTYRPGEAFEKNVPEWPALDRVADTWVTRVIFIGLYFAVYFFFATHWWMWLLLPVHFVIGPVQGAIINWCGHKYGYVNFPDTKDFSKNVLPIDVITGGEIFQNNHHKHPGRANLAARLFELDPTYPAIRLLGGLGVLRITQR